MRESLRGLVNQNRFDYVLLDFRDEEAYESGHIPTALRVPSGDLRGCLPSENLFESIYICADRPRVSARAARVLSESGYFNVVDFGPVRRWPGALEEGPGRLWRDHVRRKE